MSTKVCNLAIISNVQSRDFETILEGLWTLCDIKCFHAQMACGRVAKSSEVCFCVSIARSALQVLQK